MTLVSGPRLDPYEILAPIGAGGMGEVSRARDTRLNRNVAIKVLPSHHEVPAAWVGLWELPSAVTGGRRSSSKAPTP